MNEFFVHDGFFLLEAGAGLRLETIHPSRVSRTIKEIKGIASLFTFYIIVLCCHVLLSDCFLFRLSSTILLDDRVSQKK